MALLVALAAAWASGAADPASPIYVEELRASLADVSHTAGPYEDVIVGIGDTDRQRLVDVTDDAAAALGDLRTLIDAAPEGQGLAAPLAVLGEAITVWERGVLEFRTQLLVAADEPDAVGIDVLLTNSLVDLYAGDRLYAGFVERYTASEADAPITDFPDIGFLPDSYPIGGAAAQLVEVARADGARIRLRPDVAIDQVATDPELVFNTDEQLVVVFTDTLTVSVVVVNGGNGASEPIDLSLELLGQGGTLTELTSKVDPLDAGGKTTVRFEPLQVEPGATYEMNLTLPLMEGEEESDDNLRSFTFRVNEQTTTDTTEAPQ